MALRGLALLLACCAAANAFVAPQRALQARPAARVASEAWTWTLHAKPPSDIRPKPGEVESGQELGLKVLAPAAVDESFASSSSRVERETFCPP